MTPKQEEFISFVKKECKKSNIKCDLRKVSYMILDGSIKCSGYFSGEEDNPVLACATRRSDWIEILAHEYCHSRQWLEKIDLWENCGNSLEKIEEWLSGKRIKNIDKHLAASRDLELDNEKRTVKLLEEWDLGVDIDHYIRKANAYVLFYNYLRFSRKWCTPHNSPYKNKRLLDAMSTKFDMDYVNLNDDIKKIFVEERI